MKKSGKENFTAEEMLIFIGVTITLCLLFLGSVYLAVTHMFSGIDVIRYTVPARSPESADPLSLIAYLREVGLLQHISGMPQSAKVYFARDAITTVVCVVFAAAAVMFGVMFCRRYMSRFELEDAEAREIDKQ